MPIKFCLTKLVIIGVLLVSCLLSTYAAVIDDLFDAKVAVLDQSDKNKQKAFLKGLKQVLVKVRGSDDLLKNTQVRKGMSRVQHFVRSYQYEQEQQLIISIRFDQERIENLIRTAGFPIWDKRRPDSLIWLAIELPSKNGLTSRQLITKEERPDIYETLTLQAAMRGIRLVFPLWDLEDRQRLSVYDIWGSFSQQISLASERYTATSVLSARIYQASKDAGSASYNGQINAEWIADWTMIENGQFLSGQVKGMELLDVIPKLVNALADQLSVKYAIDLSTLKSSQAKTEIVINNIDSLQNYVAVLTFLESLSVVNSVSLVSQQGNQARFSLSLLGSLEDLSNAFKLDKSINPITDEFGQPLSDLEFIWHK